MPILCKQKIEGKDERMSLKYIAVRLKSIYDGKAGFSRQGSTVVKSGIEKLDPTIRNITESLYSNGMPYDIDGCYMHWFLIDDNHTIEHYLCLNEIEIAFDFEWFKKQQAKIRGLSGIRYYNACAEIAQTFIIKNQQRTIDYTTAKRKTA